LRKYTVEDVTTEAEPKAYDASGSSYFWNLMLAELIKATGGNFL
jgi:hypothetical protein